MTIPKARYDFTPRELGLMDGYHDGLQFGIGYTWEDPDKNEEYDQGVNEGQSRAEGEGR